MAELQPLSAEVVKDVPPTPPLQSDVLIYRVPDILTAISAGAIGSLAGLLSPIGHRR